MRERGRLTQNLRQRRRRRCPCAGPAAAHATSSRCQLWHGACFLTRLVNLEQPEGSRAAVAAPLGNVSALPRRGTATRTARLVIVEDGASLRDLEPPPNGCEHTVVIVQSRGELPATFAQRVRRRLCSLQEERVGVVWAVFLLGPRADAEAQSARILIGRWLNRHAEMLPTRSSVLALHAPAAMQPWVLKLFDVLLVEPGCPALSAHLRFDQPGREKSMLRALQPSLGTACAV